MYESTLPTDIPAIKNALASVRKLSIFNHHEKKKTEKEPKEYFGIKKSDLEKF